MEREWLERGRAATQQPVGAEVPPGAKGCAPPQQQRQRYLARALASLQLSLSPQLCRHARKSCLLHGLAAACTNMQFALSAG